MEMRPKVVAVHRFFPFLGGLHPRMGLRGGFLPLLINNGGLLGRKGCISSSSKRFI